MKLYYALKKESIALWRNRSALLALFMMPSLFILIMSLALKDVYNEYNHAKFAYLIVNLDKGEASQRLIAALKTEDTLPFVEKENVEEAKRLVREELFTFAVVIHQNFSQTLYKIDAKKLVDIYTNTMTKAPMKLYFESKIVEKILMLKVQRMLDAITMYNDAVKPTPNSALIRSHYLHKNGQEKRIPTATQQNVPAWIVFSMFFVVIPISTLFITERDEGTFSRLKAINGSKMTLFVSKIIPYMVINQLQLILMIIVGVVCVPLLGGEALDIDIHFLALFIISLSVSFGAVGFALLLSTLMKSVEQASTIGALSGIIMGAVGGIMVPKLVMPPLMQTLTILSPMSWGLEGMVDVFVRQLGVVSVVPESAVLTLFGIISLILASIFYERDL